MINTILTFIGLLSLIIIPMSLVVIMIIGVLYCILDYFNWKGLNDEN